MVMPAISDATIVVYTGNREPFLEPIMVGIKTGSKYLHGFGITWYVSLHTTWKVVLSTQISTSSSPLIIDQSIGRIHKKGNEQLTGQGSIFIVDEDQSGTHRLRGILEANGYTVDSTTRGKDALSAILNSKPDLVLVGDRLPDINPFKFIAQLKEGEQTLYIPIIIIAAMDDTEARLKGVEVGDDLITTPYDTREVLARVERQVTVSKVRIALHESETKFRSVMESAIDAIISADSKGIIRAWNKAAMALFGFNENEVIGKPIEVIIPERFRKLHREGIARVTSGGPSHVIGKTVEVAALRKDGSEFPVELSLATWFLEKKRYYTGIIRDISERKQAEKKFRSVTESAIDAIISADHKGIIVSWNHAASRILGHSPEEAIGQPLELIIPERFHERHREGIHRVSSGGESHLIGQTVELFARHKSGEELPIELSLSTWTVRDDRYYTGIIRDIRERKQAEEALRMSEQALREKTIELKAKNDELESTLNQLQQMQNQLIMQEKMASLGKLSAGMAHEMNNPASATQRSAVQLKDRFSQLLEVSMKIGGLNLKKAQLDHLMALGELAVEHAKHPIQMNALARNDKESEMENILAQQGFENAWELAPTLVSIGYGKNEIDSLSKQMGRNQFELVIDWLNCTFTIYSLLSEIGLGTDRIIEIVKALKTYTFMDRAPIQTVNIHEGLDNTLIILKNKLKSGITVHRRYASDLPSIQAYGGELNQVWTNIIDNAIDAMSGQGTLAISTFKEDAWIVVEIEDTGAGIPKEIQPKIFDPFFTTKPPGEGSGLGLNISRNLIVQKHKGKITVSSKPGKTCFTVRLPIMAHQQDQ